VSAFAGSNGKVAPSADTAPAATRSDVAEHRLGDLDNLAFGWRSDSGGGHGTCTSRLGPRPET
jgi:hypothetical protein